MRDGDIIRVRNFRDYGPDGKSWVEYAVRDSRAKRQKLEEKEVFILLALGIEPMVLSDEQCKNYQSRVEAALHAIGLVSIDDAIKAGADPKKFDFEVIDTRAEED